MKNKAAIMSVMMSTMLMNPMSIYAETMAENNVSMPGAGIMVDKMDEAKPSAGAGSELSESKLEKIITDVKKRLPINDKEAEFNYSVGLEYGQNYYSLSWETKEASQQVRYGADGNIYDYYHYPKMDYGIGQEIKKLPEYTQAEMARLAQEFLAKCFPAEYKNFTLTRNEFNRGNHNLEYRYSKNGIPVENVTASVTINDSTGQIRSYGTSYNGAVKYDATGGIVSKASAEQTYKTKMGLKKIYTYDYDYENKTLKNVKIVYVPRLDSRYAIDAKTGAVVLTQEGRYRLNESKSMGGAVQDAASNLTPQERTQIQLKSGLKSMEQAQAAVQGTGLVPRDAKLTGTSLYERIYDETTYVWSLNYTKGEDYYGIELDAESLALTSFYGGATYSSEKAVTANDIAKAKAAAASFVNKFGQKYQGKMELNTAELENNIGTKTNTVVLEYVRFENDAYLMGNGINLTYDIKQNKIVGYNLNWTKINLPKYSTYADENIVFKQIFEENKIGLTYKLSLDENTQTDRAKLYYDVQGDQPLVFSAQTGERIKSEAISTGITYSDINDSQYKDEINALAALGIGFKDGKLAPKATITQKEFLDLLLQTKQYYYPMPLDAGKDINTAPYVAASLLLKGEQITNNPLTRQEAAKYIVRAAGYEKLAQHTEIFVAQIPDISQADNALKGHIIISNTLGFTDTGKNQKFSPKSSTSREVALKMIYNYLAQQ